MKKFIASLLFILIAAGIAIGQPNFPFAFIGRWQPSEDPLLIDDNGFQDIQNLRKDGKRLKGVAGHTKINTTALNATYKYLKNGFHFTKDQPSESHVIVYTTDSAGANGRLYQNETAIPSAGDFSAAILHTDESGGTIGRFSKAPQGNMLYANGVESCVWGGDEAMPVSFITSSATVVNTVTSAKDYSEAVRNSLSTSDEVAIIGGGNDANTVLLMHFDGADAEATTMPDSSTGGAHGNATVVGDAQYDTAQAKFGVSSLLLDGTGDYISYADDSDWNFADGNFTIDWWARFTDLGSAKYDGHFGQYDDTDNFILFDTWGVGGAYAVQCRIKNTGTEVQLLATGISLVEDAWYHFAVVRNSDQWRIYINGVVQNTVNSSMTYPDLSGVFEIGRRRYSATYYYMTGNIDEFTITKGVAKWTTNFTPQESEYATFGRTWLVGYYRPLQGVKFYVGDGNSQASTMTVKEWQGDTWQTLTVTDNTDTGASLATTGTVTWTKTGLAEIKYVEGLSLYWYQFSIDAGDATIYQVTVDAPFGDIRNVWDGTEIPVASFKLYDASTYKDYTDYVNSDAPDDLAPLDALDTTHYLLLGFTEPQQGFNVRLVPGEENSTATVLTVSYWNGGGWSSVRALNDGTIESATSFYKSGTISFQPANKGEEFPVEISDDVPLYYYKLNFSVQLDASVDLYYVTGIPYPYPIGAYKFPGFFQNRPWLFSETAGLKNKAIYGAYNSTDIWNGDDSGELYFGDESELTAAVVIYNVFQTTGYEQLLVTKTNETYRLVGDGPVNWVVTKMSENIGCVAPLSMAVCDVADISTDTKRHVAIWQSGQGVFMCDGATIVLISGDVSNYWDPHSSDYIPATRQDDSVGWYDSNLQSYKLLISSGSGQATHNVELEYSLKYKEWTKLLRESSDENQDTGDFTEHDAKTAIVLTDSDTVTITDIDHDEPSWVVRDLGAGYLSEDFEFQTKINVSAITSPAEVFVWAVANSDNPMGTIDTASGDYLGVYYNAYYLWIERCDSGSLTAYQITTPLALNTNYWLKIVRDESVGTYGTLYCYVYTDEEMVTLFASGSLALGDMDDFRYLYWMSGSARGVGGSSWTGTIEALRFITGNENQLQIGFQVEDTTGNNYSYGGTNEGIMYRLENGVTWAGTNIEEYVWTKDFLPSESMMTDTVIDYFRLLLEKKTNTAGEDISVSHYCNRSQTANGVNNQESPDDIDPDSSMMATQDTVLGPCLTHSFKLSCSVDSMVDGMELLGIGLYYSPQGLTVD